MKSFFPKGIPDIVPVAESEKSANDSEKEGGIVSKQPYAVDETSEDAISSDAQLGVQKIEATTSIWIIYFIDAMQQTVTGSLTPYVTSAFKEHSLTATTSIMSSLIGGIFQLPLAKILNIWGRPQGFALMVFILSMGLIMMAACKNVQTYAAAQVFYWVGYNGLSFTLSIFIADTSALKNRGLMFAFVSSPYIATVWIGGPIATSLLNGIGFRWGFGIFAIVTPIMTLPLFALFTYNYGKAKKAGLITVRSSGRTTLQSIKHYAIEFDLAGVILLVGGLALFLLPFSLYSYQAQGWKSPMIICILVFGCVLLVAFALFEKYLAPKTFIPYELLTDRTVLGACILSAILFVEFYIWDSYFTSFLQVVNNLTITQTSYVANIYSIGSCFFSLIVGGLIRWSGRFKWLALYFGVPLTILGVGLMINFRQPDVNIGFIIMCQIFIAFSGGTLVICEEIAAMAAVSHQYIAVILAVEGMFANIGGAIGSTVAGAIWTGVFPVKLVEYLPQEAQANWTIIYGDLTTQLSYTVGTPTRDAIVRAYGDAQKIVCIAAVAVWRDIKVNNFKQVKGRVI